jgi:hypothetical protein
MLKTLIVCVVGMLLLVVVWFVVQKLWGNTFAEYTTDDDVLAGRMSCGNCGCTTACKNNSNLSSTE